MAFRGLFIGVDRYTHPAVPQLSCAARDATALHALFTDNFGDGAELLTNDAATRKGVVDGLAALANAAPDDVVVIAFSGHGSQTHELIPVDADLFDLDATALSLDTLTELVSAIPARVAVCILDCCFSGGAGAKVLSLPITARGVADMSVDDRLSRVAGDGRLILTASAADQEAWEDPRSGHGLLTKALIDVLLGDPRAAAGDMVGLYPLLHRVVEAVTAGAAAFGARQTPTLRGRVDGALRWPVFAPGARYTSLFPERHRAPATADLASLEPFGIPAPVLAAWGERISGLNALQLSAVNDAGLLDGEHVVVSAPTSSGKTLLGEMVALQGVARGQRTVFLLSTKALVNDKFQAFKGTYDELGVRMVRATGEIDDDVPDILRGRFDLGLFTYEKFAGMVLAAPHLLRLVTAVVVDEVQTLVDAGRGPNLEFLLTLIRSQRARGVEPQLVALSAVLGDVGGLDDWLGARLLVHDERPVPLREGVLLTDGTWRYVDGSGAEQAERRIQAVGWASRAQDLLVPLVRQLVGEGKQVLVFRNTRGATRGCATYLAQALGLPAASAVIEALPAGDQSGASRALRQCLSGGVAFHNAELDRDEKLAVEQAFRAPDSGVRVIVATTTLAQGVNTPAEAVVVVELDHPAGLTSHPYTVAEYKNIVGRAGRLGFAAAGESYVLITGNLHEHRIWEHYVSGTPEAVHSQLFAGSDVATLVLKVLTATEAFGHQDGSTERVGLTAADVAAFLSLSLAAHQAERRGEVVLTPAQIEQTVTDLLGAGLLTADADDRLSATDLGRLAGGGVVGAAGVLALSRALAQVPASVFSDEVAGPATLIAAAQVTPELGDVYMSVNGRGVRKEIATFYSQLQRSGAGSVAAALNNAPERTSAIRAKKAVACLLWVNGVARAQMDQVLTQHQRERDAAGTAQAVAARTQDVLPVVLEVVRLVSPDVDPAALAVLAEELPLQLELGVPRSCVALGRRFGQGLPRSCYLRLHERQLTQPEAIVEAGQDAVAEALTADLGRAQARAGAEDVVGWAVDYQVDAGPSLDDLLPQAGSPTS